MPPDFGASAFVLRRTGRRPLRFAGALIYRDIWHFQVSDAGVVLGLYETAPRGFVVEMGCVPPPGSGALPWHAARSMDNLEAAVACLETARPDCAPLADGGTDALAALRATALRMCVDGGLRNLFAHAVGAFLFDLCTSESTRKRLTGYAE